MSGTLRWRQLQLGNGIIQSGKVAFGEYVRLVIDGRCQYDFMRHLFFEPRPGEEAWQMWLETDTASIQAGTPEFIEEVGSMIRHRGLLANLSLRENLLLPFLYRGEDERLQKAEDEVNEVAEFIGLASSLNEQAGERSAYTHALVSLGRCLLRRPDIIIAQEVHVGMPPDRLTHFRALAVEALNVLGSGILYLTATEHEGSGVEFSRTLSLDIPGKA
ncbi:MAG: hypothetical protein ACE5F3_00210 [Mariprofundaceae bacterium]